MGNAASVSMLLILALSVFSISGCIIKGDDTNQTQNVTASPADSSNATVAPPPPGNTTISPPESNATANNTPAMMLFTRHYFKDFSFEYPSSLNISNSTSVFAGQHDLEGSTGEVMVVSVIDARKVYGDPADKDFKGDPSKAVADFLIQDKKDDPSNLLDQAYEYGDVSTFSIGRDAYVAELPFSIHFSGFQSRYAGYAISMYIPERSLQVRARIIALDPLVAKTMRDTFIGTFRMEKGS